MPESAQILNRGVLVRILSGELNDWTMGQVRAADGWVDDALDILESEEPSLHTFLQRDPDVDCAHSATMTAIGRLIYRDAQRGIDFDTSMARVSALSFRFAMATAYQAVLRARPLVCEVVAPLMMKEEGVEHSDKRSRSGRVRRGGPVRDRSVPDSQEAGSDGERRPQE